MAAEKEGVPEAEVVQNRQFISTTDFTPTVFTTLLLQYYCY